jgi:hypothetical protein
VVTARVALVQSDRRMGDLAGLTPCEWLFRALPTGRAGSLDLKDLADAYYCPPAAGRC